MGLDVYWYRKSAPLIPDSYEGDDGEKVDCSYPDSLPQEPSNCHPKHYCKRGYLRSSYNSGGTNTVLHRVGVPGFGEILGIENECGTDIDWAASKERCLDAIELMKARMKTLGNLAVTTLYEMFPPKTVAETATEALDLVAETVAKRAKKREETIDNEPMFDWYSTGQGSFWLTPPLKVVAAIPGRMQVNFFAPHKSGGPGHAVYLVYIEDREPEPGVTWEPGPYGWYLAALEVLLENIEWCLAQDDPDDYGVIWSC